MKRKQHIRILITFALIVIIFSVLTVNVFVVSVLGYHFNSGTNIKDVVKNIHTVTETIYARRGAITDTNGTILTEDTTAYTLYAYIAPDRYNQYNEPAFVDNPEDAARKISEVIGESYDRVLEILSSETQKQVEFGSKGKYLTYAQKVMLESYKIPGLGFYEIIKREYPSQNLASTLIGITTYDEVNKIQNGIMGIESYYNDVLNGSNGHEVYRQDRDQYRFDTIEHLTQPAVDGKNVKLTIEKTIQEELDSTLMSFLSLEEIAASEAWGAVMDVKTGKILAMADAPAFDASDPNTVYINRATQYAYEPGSTMKTFTYAASLDVGAHDPNSLFDSSSFYLFVDPQTGKGSRSKTRTSFTVNNAGSRNYGMITYDYGYQMSSNVMIAELLTSKLDHTVFQDYLHDLGFYQPIQFDRIPESSGIELWNRVPEIITNGFGQGSTVTMLQLLQAHTAIFNNGTMIKPYVIEEIYNPNTEQVEYQGKTEVLKQVFKESTAKKMQELMHDNVENVAGKRFNVPEVNIMAKTGTAQFVKDGEYAKNEFIYSVAIGFPYENPKYMIYTAYRAHMNHDERASAEQIKNIIRKIVTLDPESTNQGSENGSSVSSRQLDNYINLNVAKANTILNDLGYNVLVFGKGDTVINQYPKQYETILSNERVMLFTSKNELSVPNMSGWSGKEVRAFASFTGLNINIEGNGFVVSQSVLEGTEINNETLVDVILD